MGGLAMQRALVLAVISLLGVLPVQTARAAFPERPIRLIVAFPPGGSIDVVARILADKLRVGFGQPIVVENRAGGAGIELVNAPYRGFGQALPDLMAGLLACAMETPANIEQHVRAGTVRPIAVTSVAALAMFPGAVPLSSAYPGVTVEGWQAIFLPA